MRPAVTLVAHEVGSMGGMERQLAELVTGLLQRGHTVTVLARVCAIAPHPGLRWHHVPGPARPFALAYPWFFLAGSFLVRRHRRGIPVPRRLCGRVPMQGSAIPLLKR